MNSIHFSSVLPEVFAGTPPDKSDIWRQDFRFEQGRTYLLEADSGRGKSTFCSYLLGYRCDYSGTITFDETDIRTFKASHWSRIRQSEISCVYQELRLFPELTAIENVEIKNSLTKHKSRKQIEDWFEQLDIADKTGVRIAHMSFGQQQRVALIRALCQPFHFLLADEPVSHLDERNARAVAEIVSEEVRTQGASLIVTSIGKQLPVDYDSVIRV
ncbi:MAG: ATP-binding cassette domain-containing protein [Prevotella sp.]|nr:ATP-binding cassette domain-containing protein [Prevotella sp.]